MADDYLFAGNSVGDVLRALREFVLGLDANAVLATPVEDMLDRVVAQFQIECPVLRRDEQYSPGATDVRIDVTGDFRRATFGPGPHYVAGTKFSLHIPFDGERDVFFLRPNPFSLSPPRATVTGQELVLTVQGPADSLDPEAMRRQLDEQLAQIILSEPASRSVSTTPNFGTPHGRYWIVAGRRCWPTAHSRSTLPFRSRAETTARRLSPWMSRRSADPCRPLPSRRSRRSGPSRRSAEMTSRSSSA